MFAMPETAIGLFPDVGMTHGLSRLSGALCEGGDSLEIGKFIGLTGTRLNAADCLDFGIGTHFIAQENIPKLQTHFEQKFNGAGQLSVGEVREFLESSGFVSNSAAEDLKPNVSQHHEVIKRAFKGSVHDIFKNLEKDGSDFAKDTLKTLSKMSPLSLRVSAEAIERHAKEGISLQDALKLEYRLCYGCMRAPPQGDFEEGVRALLIEKRKVQWSHEGIDDVSEV
jgi:enoyl-CoA hydratase/carnithine racemase